MEAMLKNHARKGLALPPLRILVRRSSSVLMTPLSAGGIAAAAALSARSTVGLPSCANNHVADCTKCRQACDDCKDDQNVEQIVSVTTTTEGGAT